MGVRETAGLASGANSYSNSAVGHLAFHDLLRGLGYRTLRAVMRTQINYYPLNMTHAKVDRHGRAMACEIGELLDLAAIDGLIQCLAGREMSVERADADAGLPRDGFQASLTAAG